MEFERENILGPAPSEAGARRRNRLDPRERIPPEDAFELTDISDERPAPGGPADIRPVSILDEMKRSYLDYAMSVIVSRALPDGPDPLKPIHRRILYAMHELNFTPSRPYNKTSRTVGDTTGKCHPHGDLAIYDALVRIAQDFSMRAPLIDGQG